MGRHQAVLGKNRSHSKWNLITSGVPQGSVLGPLLFLIFINDLRNVIKHCSRILYADDLQIYIQSSPEHVCNNLALIQEDVSSILHWSLENCLSLNLAKTVAIIFGTKAQVDSLCNVALQIKVSNNNISFVKSSKNLGVIIDHTLTWTEHINKMVKTINYILYKLRYFRHLTNHFLRKHLITTLVFPHLDYCLAAIGELNISQNTILQRLLNSCVRYVSGIHIRESITPHRLKLGWLSIANRRKLTSLVFLYKVIKTGKPQYLWDKITPYILPRPLRPSNIEYRVPNVTSGNYEKSVFVSTIRDWNFLPPDVRNSPNITNFKHTLHAHLLKSERNHQIIISKL